MRLIILPVYLEYNIILMRGRITGKFSELVFNLDDVGSSDWEDPKPRTVIGLLAVTHGDVFHPMSRKYRHVRVLARIFATSDALVPMILS
jgi:hypothetical protein